MAKLKDSGERKTFDTNASRDISEGKGRCDLLPLGIVHKVFTYYTDDWAALNPLRADNKTMISPPKCLESIDIYIRKNDISSLYDAICSFIDGRYSGDFITATLEVAIHYEDGARKYEERNWEKGIPLHCFIDSGVRHLLKYFRGDEDEPHDRAFLWNMLGALWTLENRPEMNDIHCK